MEKSSSRCSQGKKQYVLDATISLKHGGAEIYNVFACLCVLFPCRNGKNKSVGCLYKRQLPNWGTELRKQTSIYLSSEPL